MYCKNCGKEVDDNAYVCPFCGVKQYEDIVQPKLNGADDLSIAAIICAVLIPIVGLILSIISYNNHKLNYTNEYSVKLTKSALIISIVLICLSVVNTIVFSVLYSLELIYLF